MGGLCRV